MSAYHDDNDDYHDDETESTDMMLSPDMGNSMKIVEQVMGEELEKLKSRKAKLREGQRALNKIRERIEMVSCTDTNRLKLNVGGKRVELKMSHVDRNNFFRPLLTNAFTQPDSEGFYFIDRDPTFVNVIINFTSVVIIMNIVFLTTTISQVSSWSLGFRLLAIAL